MVGLDCGSPAPYPWVGHNRYNVCLFIYTFMGDDVVIAEIHI